MEKYFSFTIDDRGMAQLIFDLADEQVNILTNEMLLEFDKLLDKIGSDKSIKTLVLKSGKKDNFIAGVDVNLIKSITDESEAYEKSRLGQRIVGKLENLPFPTICVINGSCVGGGLELALACTYRIATDNPKTTIGLPEVNIGIIPGFGGTQRLPRLIGLSSALKLILTGKLVSGKDAFKMKIVDALYPTEFIEDKTEEFVRSIQQRSFQAAVIKRRKKRPFAIKLLESFLGRWLIYSRAKKDLFKKTRGHYPAPVETLRVVKKTYRKSLTRGLKREAEGLAKMVVTEVSKNLSGLFFIQEKLKKEDWGTGDVGIKPTTSTAVLGAGVMGGGIAWLFSRYDIPVQMKDINYDAIHKGLAQARSFYDQLKKRKKISEREINLGMHKISWSLDYAGFKKHDVVVEAVPENLDLKKKILQELESEIKENAIIATNTSSISVDELAKALDHPERFAGMHFFNPVNRMPLVEVVSSKNTAKETIASVVSLSRTLHKTPIVVNNGPGFLVNRILMPFLNESVSMFEQGVDFSFIDKIFLDFGMPMGPFALLDEIGIDVGYKVAKILSEAFQERMPVGDGFDFLLENKFLGKKSNIGFYVYSGKKKTVNQKVVQQFQHQKSSSNKEETLERALFMMINEAAYCLDEKIIEQPHYLDMALILGIGFPPFRGGLLKYADKITPATITKKMEHYAKKYGQRFQPAPLLKQLAEKNGTFYER